MSKRPPKETNELAKYVVDVTTGEAEKIEPAKKNPHAQALGKLGGRKGAQVRNEKLSATRRAEIARKAARARWNKN